MQARCIAVAAIDARPDGETGVEVSGRMSKDVKRHGARKTAAGGAPATGELPDGTAPANQFDLLAIIDEVLRPLPLATLAIDHRGRVVLANTRALELFNARQSDLQEQPLGELFPAAEASEAAAPADATLSRIAAGGTTLVARRSDGIRFDVRAVAHPWSLKGRAMTLIALQDPSPAADSPKQAAERDELLRVVLSGMPAMVSVKDRYGRYVLVNDYQAEFLGVSPDQAVGRTTSDLIGSDAGSAIDALDRQVASGAGLLFTVEETIKDRNGRDGVWLTTKSALRDSDGEVDKIFSVSIDISEQKLLEERAASLVNYDALTGLPNRPLLMRRIHEAVRHAKRARSRVAIVVLDIDNLKDIERSDGEGATDHVLRRAAIRLSSTIRETDAVGRPGNESFAVLLNHIADPEEALAEGARFAASLGEPFQLRGSLARLQVSHGVAVYPDDGRDEHELMEAADIAINRARTRSRQGREPLQASSQEQSRRRALHNGLRRALEHGQLTMAVLPEVDLATGAIVRGETLTRWRHPEHGDIPPEEFIEVAESSEFLDAFTEWSLREACQTAAGWTEGPLAEVAVVVNLSASQFFYPDLVDLVADTLDQAGLDPGRLAVEVDELAAMQDPDLAANIVAELAAAGVGASLDRFGAEATSLAFVEALQAPSLKIDRSFMADWRNKGGLIRAAATLGGSLGKRMVATGIETVEQLRLARTAGCQGGQGFLFAQPLSVADFVRLVSDTDGKLTLPE
ncbi:putative bifunctional diguanylate cyclase/phosphodiesterase [Thalassobaculum fulvum]|nr:bifunctional diguanylate cyclase/phosphodiesterase [Thalassobaculum fulvum]